MLLGIMPFWFIFSHISGNGTFPEKLTQEEEEKYLQQYEEGNTEEKIQAKNILIERNLRLVAHIVKKYNSKDSDDLIGVGSIGLIKAIATFKRNKGTKLATYASRCIDNEILMYLRSSKKYANEVFLHDPVGVDKEGNEVTIGDKLADAGYTIDEQVELKIQIKNLYKTINNILTPREKIIVQLRYGLVSGEEITQREIAKLLGISRSYVSRIEKRAVKKLTNEIAIER